MRDIELRRTSGDDWATVRRLRLLALRRNPWDFDADESAETTRSEADWRAWVTGTADAPRTVWLATISGSPVGIIAGRFSGEHCHIGSLWVSPLYRRQGIGGLLLEAAERWAARSGCRQCTLGVAEDNPAAALYRNSGYEPTGEHKTTRWGRRELEMGKTLRPSDPDRLP